MSAKIAKLSSLATVAGLFLVAGCQCTISTTVQQPQSQLARVGSQVQFDVGKGGRVADASFQWYLNCAQIDPSRAKELGIRGANEPKLTIESVQPGHVGYYQCVIESVNRGGRREAVVTEPAELMVYHQSVLTVYGTPIGGSASPGANNCPPNSKGYVCFRKTTSPYGWKLTDPTKGGTASDNTGTGTVVRYFGSTLAKNACGAESVAVPKDSDVYRFIIYFTNTVPSGPYSIKLDGFEP